MDRHFVFVPVVICICPSYKHRQAKVHECPYHIFSPIVLGKLTMKAIGFIPELYQVIRLLFFFLVICSQEPCQRKGIIVGMKRKVESWKRRRYVLLFLGNKLAGIVVDFSSFFSLNVCTCCHHSVVMSLPFPKVQHHHL